MLLGEVPLPIVFFSGIQSKETCGPIQEKNLGFDLSV